MHGSIFQFEGQATVFYPGKGPCYRCLYPEPPPAEMAPSCAEAGVLGVLPGLIGVIEALEAVKLILGKGDSSGWPIAALQHADHGDQYAEAAARSELPDVRRQSDDP